MAGTIVSGLATPWGIAFLPDGSALVAERDSGRILAVPAGGGSSRPIGTVPGVRHGGEGGLLGLAVASTYSTDHLLYAYFTAADGNRVVRMTYIGSSLGTPQPLVTGIPSASIHNGGRIAFGPDGMLYVGTGEGGVKPRAQDLSSLGGKILRITPSGGIPADNPFPGSRVWSYGHRNVQGIAWDSSGQMWASEFGQNTWDELNRIVKGGNYGWPIVEGIGTDSRFINPVAQWPTDEASPSGIAVVDGIVYMAALRGARLWQIDVRGPAAAQPRAWFVGTYGRLRTVVSAPDGSLWVTTSNRDGRGTPRPGDDQILRVTLSS